MTIYIFLGNNNIVLDISEKITYVKRQNNSQGRPIIRVKQNTSEVYLPTLEKVFSVAEANSSNKNIHQFNKIRIIKNNIIDINRVIFFPYLYKYNFKDKIIQPINSLEDEKRILLKQKIGEIELSSLKSTKYLLFGGTVKKVSLISFFQILEDLIFYKNMSHTLHYVPKLYYGCDIFKNWTLNRLNLLLEKEEKILSNEISQILQEQKKIDNIKTFKGLIKIKKTC